MPRPKALTGEREAEARRLLGAGVSTTKIAAQFGVDHKTIAKLGRREGPYASPTGHVEAPIVATPGDAFEADQLRTYDVIKTSIETGDHDARGLAQLVKAQNDTIKAIRAHRIQGGAANDDPNALDAVADTVIARLQRLNARSPQPPPASVEVVEPFEDIENGS